MQSLANRHQTHPCLAPQCLAPQRLAPQRLAPQVLAPQVLTTQRLAPQRLAPQRLAPQCLAPQPPALSQEMYLFFATAIHQHCQARVGQEVRRGEQEVSRGGQEGSQREVRSRPSSLVSSIGAVLRRKEVLSEAALVCEDDVARPGHMMAAETSAVKSAASLTGKDVLHTDPCREEDGKRKAQQELTLTGKDVVVSPSEDMKENRVEVDETQEQLEEKQKTKETQEEKQKTKETQEEEQKINEQSIKEDQTNKEKNSKEPPEKEQGNKEQSNEAPTEGGDNKGPAVEEGAPEMDQRRSKRGHPSPVPPSTKPLSTRRSTPSMKRESPGELPVEKAVSVEVEASSSPRGGEVIEGVQLPTRGKRGRPTKQTAKNVRVKKEQPTAPVAEESGKKPEVTLEEVATYQVLDSAEDEELEVKKGPPVTKGTRGRGRKAKSPMRKECKQSLEETVFEVLDSIGGDVLEDAPEQPGRPRRGLPNNDPTPEKDGKVIPDDTPEGTHGKQEQVKKEEEVVRPVVEEPQGDKQTAAGKRRSGRGRKEEVAVSGTSKMAAKEGQQRVKEEEVYQVVDSTENDAHEEEHVDPPGPRRRSQRRDPAPAVTRAPRRPAYSTQGEEPVYQVVDSMGGEEEPAPVEEQLPGLEPRRGERGRKVAGSDSATEDKAAKKMKTTEQTVPPKVNKGVGAKKAMDGRKKERQEENALVSLDEVSEEEEDYPDDSVEEEELR
ncbi:unnamed protein product [Boreogadus saida]